MVQSTLEEAGFVAHPDKCEWEPTQWLQWLGFILDLNHGHTPRLLALQNKLAEASQAPTIPARQLASIAGTIVSMGIALGSVSRLMTHAMYALIESRDTWWEKLLVTPEVLSEIEFWRTNLCSCKWQPIWYSPSAVRVVYSDVRKIGYGPERKLAKAPLGGSWRLCCVSYSW